jgi:lipopolysaccharide transport system permease protein
MPSQLQDRAQANGAAPAPPRPPADPIPAAAPAPEITRIRPHAGWEVLSLRELWRHRELVLTLAWRDIKIRYKQTVLGAAWAVLQPGLNMVVFALVFARAGGEADPKMPYPLFVYAGLLPWFFFSSAVAQAGQSVLGAERLITKVYFPRLALPFASAGAAAVDFLIASGLLAVLMLWYSAAPGPYLLLAPVLAAVVMLAALGVGALLAALHVAYRDFRYVTPFLLQLWMLATPSIYLRAQTGGAVPAWLAFVNPLTGLVSCFRAACLGGAEPFPWTSLAVSGSASVLLFVIGCLYFRKVEDGFADIV